LPPQRVRVEIQSFEKHTNHSSEDEYDPDSDDDNSIDDSNNILRITVVDNGCGMNDIKACVDPFHTSKAHATQGSATRRTRQSNEKGDNDSVVEAETAGRYGIGLTLCLLHAQRLVPGSCASIRSARNDHPHWTSVRCVIDTKGDSVKCIPSAPITKAFPEESGTAVSLLVPVRIHFVEGVASFLSLRFDFLIFFSQYCVYRGELAPQSPGHVLPNTSPDSSSV
jgi:hypothetical protein